MTSSSEPTSTKITSEHSIRVEEPLLTQDDNDVEIAYTYDALRRVTTETVAATDPS
ncbi:hypothetical protein ACWGHM_42865 [Streptomyces sp. NPDC054904]